MRSFLAEQLLAKVMRWEIEDVARERPLLQVLAEYKYDDYQQFSPGMRFTESLALWLGQFKLQEERTAAYEFVRDRLIFCSQSEMNHLVSMMYLDHIRPILVETCAKEAGIPPYCISQILESDIFRVLQRQCLFLALSDGGKIDVFRRSNPKLSHEQIFLTHELTESRVTNMLGELEKDLEVITGKPPSKGDAYFRMIFLLDDFSGSGLTNLRKSQDGSKFEGKIARFVEDTYGLSSPISKAISKNDLHLGVGLYCATEKALKHIGQHLDQLSRDRGFMYSLRAIQTIRESDAVCAPKDAAFIKCVNSYYDSKVEDRHTRIGGTDVKMGFSACGLPLVLHHNTPNNSVFLLWSWSDKIRGIFPRITRHGGEL